jgi:hypothetical protein
MSDPILRRSTKVALLHLSVPTSQLWVRPAVTRETLWACGAHQSEVEARLRGDVQGAGVTNR